MDVSDFDLDYPLFDHDQIMAGHYDDFRHRSGPGCMCANCFQASHEKKTEQADPLLAKIICE